MSMSSEALILSKLAQGDRNVFEQLFNEHYKPLCYFSHQFVQDPEVAKNIAQDVFLYLWEQKQSINITSSLKGYLYKAVRNRSLNYIKQNKRYKQMEEHDHDIIPATHSDTEASIAFSSLKEAYKVALQNLPEKCRRIFQMSRGENMSYKEIADTLDLSKNTVENQMGIALKKLRQELAPFFENKALSYVAFCWILEMFF